ncbi:hypothetical protein [Flavobacterium sp. 14A]|uniref:hypothetical protein n=1 Tax=Flavobacterium sp. 14A TaxID=2735896 RepID=UPI001571472B|nr:hypothetical protein [Flavobacterium sp. 14A]NRT13278.1 hypothetical protein [Flavobacterium sp. 14A]
MNKKLIFILKGLRKTYGMLKKQPFKFVRGQQNPEIAGKAVHDLLVADKPVMIGRFGAYEMSILLNYLAVKSKNKEFYSYITGKKVQWWWNQKLMNSMQNNAGFFPNDIKNLSQFCELMIDDIKGVDVLGSWLVSEKEVDVYRNEYSLNVHLRLLEPFWSETPWTAALKGKKVLVVHPFSETIEAQYKKRHLLFEKEILPLFELSTIKAVQSLGGESEFGSWFDALDYMKKEIDKIDYDICLIGAGAYGFSLAAHVKRSGKKAVHLGGALQLLFGIRGKRWENPEYGTVTWKIPRGSYSNLMNEHWVRPGEIDKPKNAEQVEGACYW